MIKIDQLEKYLLNTYPSNFISGTDNANIILWGKRDGYKNVPCFYSLNIGIEYNALCTDKDTLHNELKHILNDQYKRDAKFHQLYEFCNTIANQSHFPYIIIVYPALNKYKDDEWESTASPFPLNDINFYIRRNMQTSFEIVNGNELVIYIYKLLGKTYTDKGTTKGKNKSIHDYFQYWSRNNLSQYVKKLDFDGILANNNHTKYTLIEIKRSSSPMIPDWKPYIDDANNYKLQLAFSISMKSAFWLLQHTGLKEIDSKSQISFYNIKGFNKAEMDRLYSAKRTNPLKRHYGDYLSCHTQHVPLSIASTPSLDEIINNFIES